MVGIKKIRIDNIDERLDQTLSRLSGFTRSLISAHIENGFVTLNGRKLKKNSRLNIGDIVLIDFQEDKKVDLTPINIDFKIYIDNENYAVIEKPANLNVHSFKGNDDSSLVNALLYKFNIEFSDDDFRPGIVHRLDKDTSGLMIIAKNYDARLKFSTLFENRLVEKKYLAIMQGIPRFENIRVEKNIGRDRINRLKRRVDENGKEAISIFKVVERYRNAFLSEVNILTGRTHQIRVHSAFLKHPLIGDKLYGGRVIENARFGSFTRQALHATHLKFTCPYCGKIMNISSAIPEDMALLIEFLKGG